MNTDCRIIPFDKSIHHENVVELWKGVFGYEDARNEPGLVIQKKEAVSDGLFFVAESDCNKLLGTVMCGYDGHRGWIYLLAVLPELQKTGIGSQLMKHAESVLTDLGCVKINLQIIEGNKSVEKFYQALGYSTEKRISMGKQIPENV